MDQFLRHLSVLGVVLLFKPPLSLEPDVLLMLSLEEVFLHMAFLPNNPLVLAGTAVPLLIVTPLEWPVFLGVEVREPTGMGGRTCVLWWHPET